MLLTLMTMQTANERITTLKLDKNLHQILAFYFLFTRSRLLPPNTYGSRANRGDDHGFQAVVSLPIIRTQRNF